MRGTIGTKTLRGKHFVSKPAPANHPVYQQGWTAYAATSSAQATSNSTNTPPDGAREDESHQIESLISKLRDESQWGRMAPEQLAKLLGEGLIFYGGSGDESMVQYLAPLYSTVKQVCELKQRKEVFDRVSDICDRHPDWFNALYSFYFFDDDQSIVSTVAIDLAMYAPGGPDGLEGVRGQVTRAPRFQPCGGSRPPRKSRAGSKGGRGGGASGEDALIQSESA